MRLQFTIDGFGTFLRVGPWEAYARTDRIGAASWGVLREPGAVEVEAGRVRVTLSRMPAMAPERHREGASA
ncbi:hypothetical protein [Falsiroseomonas sp.]|uniref:hypothetical protein n=1 Tax=Falsiroseomonas sp. TaxID=2870721 RepID=UPI003F727119